MRSTDWIPSAEYRERLWSFVKPKLDGYPGGRRALAADCTAALEDLHGQDPLYCLPLVITAEALKPCRLLGVDSAGRSVRQSRPLASTGSRHAWIGLCEVLDIPRPLVCRLAGAI